jgi:hypothetical protein
VIDASARRFAPAVLVFVADVFFMWMYLASRAIERSVETASPLVPAGAKAVAEEWGYLWRHGMTAGWPVYIPGFFAVGFAVVLWSHGRRLAGVLPGALALLAASSVSAWVVATLTSQFVAGSFEGYSGGQLAWNLRPPPMVSAAIGCLTLLCWAMLVISAQAAVAARNVVPLLLPLGLYAGLATLRPGDLGELTRPWVVGLIDRDPSALLSTLLAVLLGTAIVWPARSPEDASSTPIPQLVGPP